MKKQRFKAVYFADHPGDQSRGKAVTLAFGHRARDVYRTIKDLSSEEVRQLLGADSYQVLASQAQHLGLSLNHYCVRTLEHAVRDGHLDGYQLPLPSPKATTDLFDPVTVTFRSGAKEPFSRWYPFLEGYSPKFVEAIVERYAPGAAGVLDPFAGTGATVFAASRMGINSFFCEINPVLQFIAATKIRVRRFKPSDRDVLVHRLLETRSFLENLDGLPPDSGLERSYSRVFGDSRFFDSQTYEQVLRLRSWVDRVSDENPLLADLLAVAILASLVPSSRMKRAGDLRYKTKTELRGPSPSIADLIERNLSRMAKDIGEDTDGLGPEPVLISENALDLAKIPSLGVDAVITSPPYVNGTNYVRNTKIELWFLRCLRTAADLRRFRLASITAGINDVQASKLPDTIPPEVRNVVARLEKDAYDARIPKMVATYFHEMLTVFSAIRDHLRPDALVAIDIGDSAYAGVHVPVQMLLTEMLKRLGMRRDQEVVLRHRRSRSGWPLLQSLLILRFDAGDVGTSPYRTATRWNANWQRFKEDVPHLNAPYSKRNWGHPWHSLCSYPGKMKPAIAHFLVKTFVPAGGKVLDPFAGVGTIPLEAALQGRKSYGFEISPAAFVVASAKLERPSQRNCREVVAALSEYLRKERPTQQELAEAETFGLNGKIAEYFEDRTLREVILARRFFQENPADTTDAQFVLASLLHILHGNRPYALSRRSHPLTPYRPSGPFEYRPLIDRLTKKLDRGLHATPSRGFSDGRMFFQDATQWWPQEVDDLDAVITSPPFFDSTRFFLANWMRLWFTGWSKQDFKTKPLGFVDERQKRSFSVYAPVIRQARQRLKGDGVLVLHLGKSAKCDMAAELSRIARPWFKSMDLLDESVLHCESHGIRDKGTVTSHQYLVLY